MKTYKTETKTVEQKRLVRTDCDFCTAEIRAPTVEDLRYLYSFSGGGYGPDVDVEVKIEMRNGWGGDGGDSKTIELDVCAKCFKDKIVSQAKNFDETDGNW